jgi:protein ImuB
MLCVWSPLWPVATWRRRRSVAAPAEPHPTPFVLIETLAGVRRLYAVDEGAATLGLHVGQKAADALALVPGLAQDEADPAADAAALEALCDWTVRFSPAVAVCPPDALYLDIEGVAHLWGGEAGLLDDLLARLTRDGVPARAAIADTPGAAWALARFGENRTIAPPGGQARLLAPLPVAALRLDPADAAQLARLGLTRIERLTAQPRAGLARRFGMALTLRLDQALGQAGEALTFRRPPTPWFHRLAFAEPISAPGDLARAARDVAEALCVRMEAEGMGGRRFIFGYHRLDGVTAFRTVGLSRLGREAGRITRLVAPKLADIDPGFGIETITLSVEGVAPLIQAQDGLDGAGRLPAEASLSALVDRLINRLGEDAVWRSEPYASHVPERAVVRRRALENHPPPQGWDPDRPRPIRLFARPEPITAIAEIPDDPPRQFQWRGRAHRVVRAEGPERIGDEWWRRPIDEVGPARVRDYYRVEDDSGARYWLFRTGLYGAGETRWFLHGLFG